MLMEKEVFFKRDWASRMRSWIRYSARPIPISRLKSRERYSGLRYSALEISERLNGVVVHFAENVLVLFPVLHCAQEQRKKMFVKLEKGLRSEAPLLV